MAVVPTESVIQFFKSHSSNAFILFLVGYITLVQGRDLKDFKEVVVEMVNHGGPRKFNYTLVNGDWGSLDVDVDAHGEYFISDSIIGKTETPND